jgi:hypothetical protein
MAFSLRSTLPTCGGCGSVQSIGSIEVSVLEHHQVTQVLIKAINGAVDVADLIEEAIRVVAVHSRHFLP